MTLVTNTQKRAKASELLILIEKRMELSKIVQESVDEKYVYLPRAFGKNTKLLIEFFVAGKAGKAVVFATPEGDFLSPKAVENKVLSSQISLLEAELERKKGMILSYIWDNGTCSLCGFEGLLSSPHDCAIFNDVVERDISYLQDQITKCKELIK